MNTASQSMSDRNLLNDYLAKLKPIPLNGISPDPDSLARWASQIFQWRHAADVLAEQAHLAMRQSGVNRTNPAQALRALADAGDPACQALLADMDTPPDWVDFELMRLGGAMAQRHFPMLILGLTYGGLPLTFAHPDAAEVFTGTGRMRANISRRLNESASLFFGIYNSDELAPGKSVWEICLQVRLVHAIVSQNLIKQGWDVAARGVPISQLATATGPAFFGTHQLGCLRRLGARISDEEALGFNMIWRYVTRLLGVPEQLLGSTQAQQDEFDQHITSLFFAPDDNARQLMQDLIIGLAEQKPTAHFPRTLQLALFRRMLGDKMADAYAIERSSIGNRQLNLLLPMLRGYGWLQRAPVLGGLLQRSGNQLLARVATQGIVKLDSAGDSR